MTPLECQQEGRKIYGGWGGEAGGVVDSASTSLIREMVSGSDRQVHLTDNSA